MTAKLKAILRSYTVVRIAWFFIYYLYIDFQRGRFRGVLLIGLANLLPDLLCFTVIRPILWRMAGVKLDDYSNTVIRAGVFTEYPSNLIIGKNFQINRNSYLDTNGPIVIGDHVTISLNCSVLTISHSGRSHEIDVIAPVVIKDHCLIYANCTILPGAVLEEGVVLAAGSVLKGATKPWSVYAGVPAKLIKVRNQIALNGT
jgi:acetyltransferase-like isoleucine patch superfamily enzyme